MFQVEKHLKAQRAENDLFWRFLQKIELEESTEINQITINHLTLRLVNNNTAVVVAEHKHNTLYTFIPPSTIVDRGSLCLRDFVVLQLILRRN
jgi:hypothetical protein